ncbi:MAG: hypothetical protein LBS27_07330 [Bifidobacteriaceae bacterium]|jgi:hypothetical protein|nr:hypothetical protein [Bifidobacteriaceae bacterium]
MLIRVGEPIIACERVRQADGQIARTASSACGKGEPGRTNLVVADGS